MDGSLCVYLLVPLPFPNNVAHSQSLALPREDGGLCLAFSGKSQRCFFLVKCLQLGPVSWLNDSLHYNSSPPPPPQFPPCKVISVC